MKMFTMFLVLFSLNAFAQVRENIKQQTVGTTDEVAEVKVIKAPVKTTKPKK